MSNILSDIMTDIARLRDTITWCEGRIMKYEIAMIQLSQSRDTADLLDEKEPIEGVKIFQSRYE